MTPAQDATALADELQTAREKYLAVFHAPMQRAEAKQVLQQLLWDDVGTIIFVLRELAALRAEPQTPAPGLRGALEKIALGRTDNGRPLGGESARQIAREALPNWPQRAALTTPLPEPKREAFDVMDTIDPDYADSFDRSTPSASAGPQAEAVMARRIELARAFIAKEFADPAQELNGDWISPEARPAHDALCLCLDALAHPQPQQADGRAPSCSDPNCKDPTCNYDNEPAPLADGRGAVIEALRELKHFTEEECPRSALMSDDYINLCKRVDAALSQAPATDGAGSSLTRPERGAGA